MKPLLFAAALTLGALGAVPTATPAPSPTPDVVVHMADFAFDPAIVTIHAGQTVEWINDDEEEHSATAADRSWNSGELQKGDTWSHTFAEPGTYRYFCDDHTFMKAEVVVEK